MELLLILFVIFLAASCIYVLMQRKEKDDCSTNYVLRETLLSPAERSFFDTLKHSASEHYEIFGKVRIADVLMPKINLDHNSWRISFRKISSKHFDYVLCNKQTLEIVAVIALEDKSHGLCRTTDGDIFVQNICRNSGLPLICFDAKTDNQIQSVRDKLLSSLNSTF